MSAPQAATLMLSGGRLDPPWTEVVNLTRFYNGSLTNVATGKGNNFQFAATTGFNNGRIKWGTTSAFQAGTNTLGWWCPTHVDYTIGTKNFVMEFWMWNTTTTLQNNGTKIWIDCRGVTTPTANVPLIYTATANGSIRYNDTITGDLITSLAGAVSNGLAWQHIAVCRNSGITRLFIDGVLIGSVADPLNYVQMLINVTSSAARNGGTGMYMSEFRLAIGPGSGIYTANFPVPTAPFPNS